MAGREDFELEIGFDLDTPSDEALSVARDRWIAAVERAGKKPTGATLELTVRQSPGLTSIGQYAIVICGAVMDGD